MMSRWLILGGVAILAACASPAERAARMQAEVEEMIAVYGPACDRLGYERNDDGWRDCILSLSSQVERRLNYYPPTTTCFGHRGFLQCSSF